MLITAHIAISRATDLKVAIRWVRTHRQLHEIGVICLDSRSSVYEFYTLSETLI